jgi:hypothetical protein
VAVKGTKSFDEMLDRAVDLTDDALLGKDVRDRLASVMEDIAPTILQDRALTAALAVKTTNAALKGDTEAFRALTAATQQSNVFRMALQREAARAVTSGNVEILSSKFPQIRKIWESVISPEEVDQTVAALGPKADSETALKAAAEAGQAVHPDIQRGRDFVTRIEDRLAAARAAGKTEESNMLTGMLNDARKGLEATEQSEQVLDAQMQIVTAAAKSGLPEEGVRSALQAFYDNVNKYGVLPAVELWQSAILSAFRTFTTNVVSPAFNSLLLRPGSRVLGAAVSLDKQGLDQGLRQWQNLLEASMDALRWNSLTMKNVFTGFRKEMPILTASGELDTTHAIPGIAGHIIRAPLAAQNASDEFFKNINYQATVRTMAQDAARLSGENPDDVLRRYLANAFESTGQAARDPETGEAIFQEALREATGATFTDELLDGTLARSIQQFAQKHPLVKFFVPFVRVPANVLSKGLDFTPGVNYFRPGQGGKNFRANLSHPDPMIRNLARGELAASALIGISAATLYGTGALTGSGPAEPRTRKAWLDAGNKPYTLKVGDNLVDLTRLDPVSMPFMVLSDLFEAYDNVKNGAEADVVGTKLLMTIHSNLTNRTFMKGLENAMNLSSGSPNDFGLAARSYAGTLIPRVVGQFATSGGPDREAKTIVESIQRQTPGWRAGLPPLRDPFGEVVAPRRGWTPLNFAAGENYFSDLVSPFTYSTKIDSPLKKHLIDMGVAFSPPDRTLPSGLDLMQFRDSNNQSAYDYWREEVGLVRLPIVRGNRPLAGKSLNVIEALQLMTEQPEYRKIKAPTRPGDPYNKRVEILRNVYEAYKMAALVNTQDHFTTALGVDLLKDDAILKAARSGIDMSPWFEELGTTEEKVNALVESAR